MRLGHIGAHAVHNVGVNHLVSRTALRGAVLLVAASVALTGCGGGNGEKPTTQPTVTLPTGNVNVPAGVTLTKAGTDLKFGEKATVAYEPNSERNTVLEMTAASVDRVDFSVAETTELVETRIASGASATISSAMPSIHSSLSPVNR